MIELTEEQRLALAAPDGQRLIERLNTEGFRVRAAGWVKESDGGSWLLHLVTPLVRKDGSGKPEAYRHLIPVLRQMPQPFWVDPMVVTVVAPHSAVGKAIRDLARRYPVASPLRYGAGQLGGRCIDGAFIYAQIKGSKGIQRLTRPE